MTDLIGDLKHATRMLAKTPGLSFVVILALTLAIAANTLGFTFADLLILRGLPVHDPDRVVYLFMVDPQGRDDRSLVSGPDFLDYRAETTTVERLSAFTGGTFTRGDMGTPVRLRAMKVTADFFGSWGVPAVLGRTLLEGDDVAGAPPAVVLAHRYWQQAFGGQPEALGQSITLSGTPHTIVGVLTPDIEFGNLALVDVWAPLVIDAAGPRADRTLRVTGRLREDAEMAQAVAEFATVGGRLAAAHPATNEGWKVRAVPLKVGISGPNFWLIIGLLFIAVLFVMLIACANVANVMLARASARAREMALRNAIGASRWRILRQVVIEGALLAAAGGAGGLLLAQAALVVVASIDAEPVFQMLRIDLHEVLFVAVLAVLAPVAFSLAPLVFFARTDMRAALNEGGRRSGGVTGRRTRGVLVVGQLSLAFVLLVVSGLALRSSQRVTDLDLGLTLDNLLVFRLETDAGRYPTTGHQRQLLDGSLDVLAQLPGARRVAVSTNLPVLDDDGRLTFTIAGQEERPASESPWAVPFIVTEDYFAALRIPLISGRAIESADAAGTPSVAVVSLATAERYWGAPERALGRRLLLTDDTDRTPLEIVGVVGNVVGNDLASGEQPAIYLPLRQAMAPVLTYVIQTSADPRRLIPDVREAMRTLAPTMVPYELEAFTDTWARLRASDHIMIGLFVGFTVVALLLASTGLYGVVAFSVGQRTSEFGTRMALGASAAGILHLVLGDGLKLLAVGLTLGLAGGLAAAHAIRATLFGVSQTDPLTFGGVAAVLTVVALAACLVPAYRAARVDPLAALRAE